MIKTLARISVLAVLALVASTSAHASFFHHQVHKNPHYQYHKPHHHKVKKQNKH